MIQVMIPAITTIAMISQSHQRLFPLSPSVGTTTAALEYTELEAGAELLSGAELVLGGELDTVGDGVGVGVGVGVDGTTGAVTWKLATPTVPDCCPMASNRWVPAAKSAGTTNSALATPV